MNADDKSGDLPACVHEVQDPTDQDRPDIRPFAGFLFGEAGGPPMSAGAEASPGAVIPADQGNQFGFANGDGAPSGQAPMKNARGSSRHAG